MSPFVYKWLKYALLSLVAGGFVALAIYALIMRDEIKNAQLEPPLIEAPTQQLKTRPEAPGGLEFPNQDKLVFDLLESSAPAGSVGGSANMAVPVSESLATAASSFPSPTATPPAAAPATPSATAALPAESVQPQQVAAAVQPATQAAVKAVIQPEPKAEAKPEPKVAAKEEAKPAGGTWGVQLAAVGSQADGQKVSKQLQGKFSALKGLKVRIVAAPGGNRFRVQFVGLPTRTAAQGVCDKLGSQPCFPVGK